MRRYLEAAATTVLILAAVAIATWLYQALTPPTWVCVLVVWGIAAAYIIWALCNAVPKEEK